MDGRNRAAAGGSRARGRDETVDGLRFRVWSTARSSGMSYVLLHGVGMSHRSYRDLHGVLATSGAVHSIDLPGFAGLPAPVDDVPVERMADALAAVIASLTDAPVVLVGHSMGAQWAVEIARRRPAAVAGLALIGPVADDRHRTLRAQGTALARDGFREPPRVNARVFADYLRSRKRWFLAQVGCMLAYPTEERLADAAVPVLLVRGGRDPIAGDAWLARLAGRAHRASVVVVPGHGHHVERTAPEAVAQAILEHLVGAGSRRP
ncbi:alpha/beta fold hydrolase [Microbacterium radiodurans]|uniref:Alpha/beta fold hydrolase n=1 Tax=Microbacterium radiodurans TaxID=661398 RepID=A0A5J5IVJ5_9MICO|nr:alpha/beta fold hydrolase [Microbacterium radiodurans]KAA9087062.1 alpha/beta fold hydrolase [Microbacterium radiodurans]